MKFENPHRLTHDVQTPDYAYADGLRIVRSIYGAPTSPTELTLPLDKLRPDVAVPEHPPHQERIVRSLGSTALEWRRIRSATDTDTVNIMLMGWAGDNDNPITQDALRYHAAYNPGADIIHINNPAHGNTTKLPLRNSLSIAHSGHFAPQGEMQAELISTALEEYEHVNIAGHSYGGRQAIALTSALERPVDNLHLLDPPGSRKLGIVGLTKAFLSLEGKHAGLYGKHAPDQAAAAIQHLGDSTGFQDLQSLLKRHGIIDQFMMQTLAMSAGGLEHDMSLAAQNVRSTIKFTSPALSELNYATDVSAILERVATVANTIQHDIVLRQTHSMIASNPNILAYVQKFDSNL
jgi:pimeloyl-ACP methyl ester carboxylesterase